MTVWTKDTLKAWILATDANNAAHRAALSRALLFLYARQTADEQSSERTSHTNGMGFGAFDAEFLSSVAKGVQKYGSMTPGQAKHVAKKIARYSGQLLELVNKTVETETIAA